MRKKERKKYIQIKKKERRKIPNEKEKKEWKKRYRVFQVSCLLKRRHIPAPWGARDFIEISVWSILKTVVYLPLYYISTIILSCLFQFHLKQDTPVRRSVRNSFVTIDEKWTFTHSKWFSAGHGKNRDGEEGGTGRKEGRGGRRDEESKKMK